MKFLKSNAIHQKYKSTLLLLTISFLSSCVTVNVNFPESAVQKASDDYVRDLYRTKEQTKSPDKTLNPKASATPIVESALNFLFPIAFAEPVLKMDSPKIGLIKAKMQDNVSDIIAQKKEGILGETSDGHLILREPKNIKPLLKSKIENLVRDENKSRDDLYAELVTYNHLGPTSRAGVGKTFARSFQSESPAKTWIQDVESNAWSQK